MTRQDLRWISLHDILIVVDILFSVIMCYASPMNLIVSIAVKQVATQMEYQ